MPGRGCGVAPRGRPRNQPRPLSQWPPPAAYAARALICAADIFEEKLGMVPPTPFLIASAISPADPETPPAWQPLQYWA